MTAGLPDTAQAKAVRRGSTIWIQGLACGALLTFAAPTALLLAVLFAPAAICVLVTTGSNRGLARAVTLGCAAASLGPGWRLWLAGGRMDQMLATLSDPLTLTLAWGAGACAWALCQVVPVMLVQAWDMQQASRTRAIEAELKSCREEWDLEI